MNDFFPSAREPLLRASTDQISADVGGETAILALADGTYYGLSGTGTFIWRLLQAPITASEIVGAVIAEYEVSAETAARDVAQLLDDLVEKRLVATA